MQLGKTWRQLIFVGVLGVMVMLGGAACGEDDPTATPSTSGTTSSGSQVSTPTTTDGTTQLSGTIEIDGSSTVAPISEAVAEEFLAEYPDVRVNVGISGTGGGFKRFTVGETEISDASRPIKDSEAGAAVANGINFIPLTVALDGLAVMVSTQNDFVNCLTVAELNEIWKPDSTVDSWDDVRSSFPNEPINLYGPDTESGTFDYFTDVVNGDEGVSRSNYVASSDDNVLVRGIAGDRNSMGYFGYAYYAENAGQLKLVSIDGGNGCVAPSDETVADGSYAPLARPIFIYVDADKLAARPELQAFVNFYLDQAPVLVPEVGYTALASYEPEKLKVATALQIMSNPVDLMSLSGTIEIDGSSTVAPISEAVAEDFGIDYNNIRVNVGVSGTGGGFKRFTVGETEISDASRPIKDTEAVAAAENGIQWVELTVALDGLAVMVSTQNDFVNCLTVAELNEIWKPDSTVDSWDDVRAGFPNEPINLYGPDTESGTFDYFTDVVNGDEGVSRSNYVASSDDNVLVRGIAGDRNSLGYFGYAYYAENASQLKLVAVDGGNGCVTPSDETVADGSYAPLARPIFIYVDVNKLRLRPELKLFVDYYLDNLPRLVPEVGYTALPNYDEEKGKLAKAYTGA